MVKSTPQKKTETRALCQNLTSNLCILEKIIQFVYYNLSNSFFTDNSSCSLDMNIQIISNGLLFFGKAVNHYPSRAVPNLHL